MRGRYCKSENCLVRFKCFDVKNSSMMKIAEILTPSMKKIHHEMGDTRALWQRRLSAESDFCKAVLRCGYLTQEQMQRAVSRE